MNSEAMICYYYLIQLAEPSA